MKYLSFLMTVFCLYHYVSAKPVAPASDTSLNLGFEQVADGRPVGWNLPEVAGYSVRVDSLSKHRGQYSLCISFDGDHPDAGGAFLQLPHIYQGKTITLSGYIKTQGVADGRAAIWVRIDPHIAMDNMSATKLTGTTDWKKYEIRVKMDPENSKAIAIGGLLIGKGKMWLDDLEIKVDDKPLEQAVVFKGKQYPADKDTSFSRASGITRMATDPQTLENLKVLGLVWGYLKYYHPGVAAGRYNWSSTLFRLMPKVAAARNSRDRDQVLSDFINSLGPVEPDYSKDKGEGRGAVQLRTDTSWFAGCSSRLSGQLSALYDAKRPWPGYYHEFSPGAGNVALLHERKFIDMRPEDVGMRLLALFRYWNAIEYFYPYRYLNGDWKKMLVKYIPRMIQADTRLKYEQGLTSLIAEIRDTHGNLNGKSVAMYKYYGAFTPAIGVSRIQDQWVVNRYLDSLKGPATGLRIGDVLERIAGVPVSEIVQKRWAITPASNDAARYRKMSWALLRTDSDSMTLLINRAGKQVPKTVKTYNIGAFRVIQFADKTKAPFERLSSGIGYLYPGTLKNGQVGAVMKKAADTKALIIDMRCYPAEFIVFSLGAQLTAKPVDFAVFSGLDYRHPGVFISRKPMIVGKENPDAYKGKVVVLVNEYTQSQAEYTTMALQAAGATVIGSTTAGADGNVSTLQLPGNLSTGFSGLGVYYPDGRETQQVGIVVDIRCEPTIQGIRAGRDELLERAVRFIEQGK